MLRGNSHRSYPPSTVDNGEGTIRLALGGAVGKTTKTRANETTITAEDDEKTVESLYAVLFKDANTEDGEEVAADLFFKAINVTDSIYQTDSVRFKVSSGDYQICFVANPSAGLFDGLTAGSSKVSDFKALVETKAPDTKPGMLMTSDFHKATVSTNDSIDIKTVTLERAMARIDIVNKADGITIDSVKLVNRATQSILISDGATTDYAAFKDTTYKALSLAGKADGTAAYKARIYSYEQYGTDANAPSMDVYYSIGTKNYTHTIKFVTKGNDDAETQINLKRNYLYTVNITNNAGKLTFVLTVADWNKGETFVVTSDELIDGTDAGIKTDYGEAELGDVMLLDGTLVSPNKITAEQQSQAVGIVAFLFKDGTRTVSDELTKALGEDVTPHGIVLALTNASTSTIMDNTAQPTSSPVYSTLKEAYAGMDGYYLTQNHISYIASCTSGSYPLFRTVVPNYRTGTKTPEKGTTAWYIPSVGDWADILGAFGGDGNTIVSTISSSTTSHVGGNKNETISNVKVIENLNSAMKACGSYTALSNGQTFWASTQQDGGIAYSVTLNDNSVNFHSVAKNLCYYYARCILAF